MAFWIPIAAAAAMAASSYKTAADQRAEARRREQLNQELGASDTMFGSFVKNKSQKVAETDPGMGGFAGALTGAAQGFQLGQNINSGLAKTGGYEQMSSKLGHGIQPTLGVDTNMAPQTANMAAMQQQLDPYNLAALQRQQGFTYASPRFGRIGG